jgi:NAD(P)-dependent dehydrogenase (short-subunit alcohol dehydrogenase family)
VSTWFITGAGRGLGYEIALQALHAGANVVASGRQRVQVEAAYADVVGLSERGLAVALDVTDETQVAAAVEEAREHFGGIDYLINNARRGLLGAGERPRPLGWRRSSPRTSSGSST